MLEIIENNLIEAMLSVFFVLALWWKNKALKGALARNSTYKSLGDGLIRQGQFVHTAACKSCNRAFYPAAKWGHKYITLETYISYLKGSKPELVQARSLKYAICIGCGAGKRRGRSPKGDQGREEESLVSGFNALACDAMYLLSRWEITSTDLFEGEEE